MKTIPSPSLPQTQSFTGSIESAGSLLDRLVVREMCQQRREREKAYEDIRICEIEVFAFFSVYRCDQLIIPISTLNTTENDKDVDAAARWLSL